MKRLGSIPLNQITITDGFWKKYTDLVHDVILPYQWEVLNDRVEGAEPSHVLRNYRIAAGEEAGSYAGKVFIDSDLAKWLEALAYSLQTRPDPELERRADEAIALLGRVQQSDGYLNTYYTIAEPGRRWSNFTEGHELYCAGHLIEAAVAYHGATGKDALLRIVTRLADLLCDTFGAGEGKQHGYPGHQEIELALVKLYRVTGQRKYLDLAMYFIDQRGGQPNYFLQEIQQEGHVQIFDELKDYDPVYSQSHMPPRQQRIAEGHAVRAVYMCSAMADLACEFDDGELLTACESIWRNIVTRRMYLTGSIGSSAHLERFTIDYDLPNDDNYSETCASIGLAQFSLRMSRIQQDAAYLDTVERALYNTVLAGISLRGDTYFYVNPLEVWPARCMEHTSMAHVKPIRQRWFNVACCPTNIARTLASLGNYIYSVDESSLYVNLFISNRTHLALGGAQVTVELDSTYLVDGRCRMTIDAAEPTALDLRIRVPGYAKGWHIAIDGEDQAQLPVENGYAVLHRVWTGRTVVELRFETPAEFVAAHPQVRADAGKVALVKGPLVYCLEEADNGSNLASVFVNPEQTLQEAYDPAFFDGAVLLHLKGRKLSQQGWNGELYRPAALRTEPVELTAIPYCYWANRGENEMMVWMHAQIPMDD